MFLVTVAETLSRITYYEVLAIRSSNYARNFNCKTQPRGFLLNFEYVSSNREFQLEIAFERFVLFEFGKRR